MATAQPLTTYYHSNQKVFLPPSSLYFNPHGTAARLTPENSFNHYIPNSKSPSTEAKGTGLHSKQSQTGPFLLRALSSSLRIQILDVPSNYLCLPQCMNSVLLVPFLCLDDLSQPVKILSHPQNKDSRSQETHLPSEM